MAFFNRKKRSDENGDNVRLTSADHAWWTGEGPSLADEEYDAVTPEALAAGHDDRDDRDDQRFGQSYDDGDGADVPPADLAGSGLLGGIADALSEYGYGHESHHTADLGDDDVPPGVHFAAELHGEWQDVESDEDRAREALEHALFARDGLPSENHLPELLGAMGLEGDADWVDIARAHRRLASASTTRGTQWEQDRQLRAANEAYACLRLFYH